MLMLITIAIAALAGGAILLFGVDNAKLGAEDVLDAYNSLLARERKRIESEGDDAISAPRPAIIDSLPAEMPPDLPLSP